MRRGEAEMDHDWMRRRKMQLEASSSTSSSSSSTSISGRRTRREEEEADVLECSGRGCKSCTTGTVTDCVAICFCPCAVVSFLGLALVKIPWSVGKKCLRIGKKSRQRRVEMKAKMMAFNAENVSVAGDLAERSTGAAEEEDDKSAEMEAEMVWMEMGQLGFGRVSFHGIQSLANFHGSN